MKRTPRWLGLRHDGVLVLQTDGPRTLTSRDRGRTWHATAFQPGELERQGAWIVTRGSPTSIGRCRKVLASDGKTWVSGALPAPFNHLTAPPGELRGGQPVGWEVLVDGLTVPFVAPAGRHPTGSTPPPPPPSPVRLCNDRVLATVRDAAAPGGCEVQGFSAQCVRGTIGRRPGNASIWIGWFADGTPVHPPTPILVDNRRGVVRAIPLPPDCSHPVRIRSLVGTAVLVCHEAPARSRLFLADAGGNWHAEGTLVVGAESLTWFTAAPDGTLLAQSCQSSAERSGPRRRGQAPCAARPSSAGRCPWAPVPRGTRSPPPTG